MDSRASANPFRRSMIAQATSSRRMLDDVEETERETSKASSHYNGWSIPAIEEPSHASAVDATALSSGKGNRDEEVSTEDKRLKPAPTPSRPSASEAIGPQEDPFDSIPDEDDSFDHEDETKQPRKTQEEVESKNQHLSSPSNPFRMSADTGPGQGRSGRISRPRPSPRPVSFAGKDARGRASLDVDAFKRLLLTGTANPTTAAGMSSSAPKTSILLGGDAASITDASSISRHSIFESVPEGQSDTPRTSHEISEDERKRWRDDLVRGTEHRRPPPPAPAPRHGKPLVTPTVHMTIDGSADDSSDGRSNNRTPRPTTTNLNKPLPSPPSASEKLDLAINVHVQPALTPNDHINALLPLSPSRRTPPKPPLSRQHSRAASHASVSRTGSIEKPKKHDLAIPKSSDGPMVEVPRPRQAPRPPTPRRSTLERTLDEPSPRLPDSLALHGEFLTSLPLTREPSTSSTISRHTSERGPGGSSSKRASTMGPPPPPPPPRRRRGSSRSSVQSGSLSGLLPPFEPPGGYMNTPRSVSEGMESSVLSRQRHSSPPPLSTEIKDKDMGMGASPNLNEALDDLTALQREVDALRGKMERVGE
ncbi:MAG: hypothetical protein M1823_003314 [Watsoniomyces obsoletus]|nr:MAG: hypothetical protein M1823_003314 [Watsoniomyces obsoletus]